VKDKIKNNINNIKEVIRIRANHELMDIDYIDKEGERKTITDGDEFDVIYYIQHLQEEIERLKQDNEYLNKVNIELSSRNSKAIEYIETHQLNFKKGTTTFGSERLSMEERKLLDILRGVDKE
jgi:hypothetical protein